MKRLILRLSSLGDVILATSALEVGPHRWDWVVASEFSELLEGDPRIGRLFKFERKSGLPGWVKLSRQIWESGYDEIFDLHGSLRTRVMHFLFFYWGTVQRGGKPRWKTISKQRWRLYPYFWLKHYWPKSLRPTPWVERYSKRVGGSGLERPQLTHLLNKKRDERDWKELPEKYTCIMPSSKWDGKKWPVEHYFKVCGRLPHLPVIFGSAKDRESQALVTQLREAGIPHLSGVGKWNLTQAAQVLAGSQGYLGGDTGLAHLAEAVGVPSRIIFGPTVPDMGFGPWREASRKIQIPLGCRPCGKDGRYCYRLKQKYLCLQALPPERVLAQVLSDLNQSPLQADLKVTPLSDS